MPKLKPMLAPSLLTGNNSKVISSGADNSCGHVSPDYSTKSNIQELARLCPESGTTSKTGSQADDLHPSKTTDNALSANTALKELPPPVNRDICNMLYEDSISLPDLESWFSSL